MIIGYARCSTQEQTLDWQLDKLTAVGCERIYQEKLTGAKMDRPELTRMLEALRKGVIGNFACTFFGKGKCLSLK